MISNQILQNTIDGLKGITRQAATLELVANHIQ